MKKFSFSLQRLLDYTRQLLDIERATLADMNAVLRGFMEELETLKGERADRASDYSRKIAEGTTPLEMERHRNYIKSLDEAIFNKGIQIDMQQKVVNNQTEKVRSVNMEISTMEKLRENKLEEYNYLDQKEQELLIDEFVNYAKASVAE